MRLVSEGRAVDTILGLRSKAMKMRDASIKAIEVASFFSILDFGRLVQLC